MNICQTIFVAVIGELELSITLNNLRSANELCYLCRSSTILLAKI